MSEKKVDCPECRGQKGILCQVCNGSKRDPRNRDKTCSYCGGTGVKTCPRCGGRGQIFQSELK